jgi:hypothetical protein
MSLRRPHSSLTMEQQRDPAGARDSHDLHHVIACIHDELRILTQRRIAILRRIAMIKQAIAGLDAVFGSGITDEELGTISAFPSCHHRDRNPGLTNCCRQLLRTESSNPLTLDEMLKLIRERYPEILAAHNTPRNSVRTALRRLVSYGEADEVRPEKGPLIWQSTALSAPDRNNGTDSGSPQRMVIR